jgi:hypothetical protein
MCLLHFICLIGFYVAPTCYLWCGDFPCSFTSAERPKVPFCELIQTRTVNWGEPPMFRKLAGKCDFDLWTNKGYLLANTNAPVKFEGKGTMSYWDIYQKPLLLIWSMWSWPLTPWPKTIIEVIFCPKATWVVKLFIENHFYMTLILVSGKSSTDQDQCTCVVWKSKSYGGLSLPKFQTCKVFFLKITFENANVNACHFHCPRA